MTHNEGMDTAAEGLKIGRIVKELRYKKQITLQDLAAKTGIPKSVLTEIESGDVVPPVATLLKLAKAFNVGMASFFEEEAAGMKISVTRSGERIRIKRRPHHHEGEEFIFVLEGRLEFRTDDRVEILQPGDTLYFESDINHSFRSLDENPAKAIAVVWSKL